MQEGLKTEIYIPNSLIFSQIKEVLSENGGQMLQIDLIESVYSILESIPITRIQIRNEIKYQLNPNGELSKEVLNDEETEIIKLKNT